MHLLSFPLPTRLPLQSHSHIGNNDIVFPINRTVQDGYRHTSWLKTRHMIGVLHPSLLPTYSPPCTYVPSTAGKSNRLQVLNLGVCSTSELWCPQHQFRVSSPGFRAPSVYSTILGFEPWCLQYLAFGVPSTAG